jgi:hypothetical protein
MNAPSQNSPRRRLEALLAIPDSQRTDAEWDELIELEITLAPGNRLGAPEPAARRTSPANPRQPRAQPNSVEGTPPKKPFRKFRKRTPKPSPE